MDTILQTGPTPDEAIAQLAAIVESSDDAIISKTLQGVILTWNAGAERVYGYTAAETIGRPMAMLLPDDRPHEEAKILSRIASGQRVEHFETVRRTKSGDLIDVSLTISPTCDRSGRITGASHIARNITDRRRLDERLQQIAAIVEFSDDAIVSKTLEGRILTWNAAAERVYGYPAAEAIGRDMAMLLPPDRPDEEADILRRIGRGERVEHFETVRRTRNGDLIDVSLTISPTRDRAGKITGASHVARDITERKRLDEQLRHTQKLESLGVLAGGVAHDFNNLLTGILGNTSLALETVSPGNPAKAFLEDVLSASERAASLIRQLLAYAGKGNFVIEPINLSKLIREIGRLILTSVSKNVQLLLELRDDLPLVSADASQLQQLIMNLVINGAEAIPPDANGTVLVTTGVQEVDSNSPGVAGGLTPGKYVTLEVRDTGCGMDEATLSRIFDPFFTTKFTGRGLGLSAVQGILRGHKGAIEVHSRPGQGTTFKVLLPQTYDRTEPDAVPAPSTRAAGELILVVDDEDIIRRTAKSMLERHGYKVLVAEDGLRGVELFQISSDKVAAVILDMTMPVMGGEETLRRLKEIRPGVKVLLSSGYSESEAIRRFAGKGLSGFLQKPYTSSVLSQKIRAILNDEPN
jgi:two-component system cell cycle sensor histidine kinase/response regulator CckA